MRRRHVHALFGAATLAAAVAVAVLATRLVQAERVNAAIARASDPGATELALPQARLAHARALARAGHYEPAVAAHKVLVREERGEVQRTAQYDLGNLYLREAIRHGPEQAARSMPLVELAKQSYRDVLRAAPDDWDARWNLERALQLAPEVDEVTGADIEPPTNKQRITTTQALPRGDLP